MGAAICQIQRGFKPRLRGHFVMCGLSARIRFGAVSNRAYGDGAVRGWGHISVVCDRLIANGAGAVRGCWELSVVCDRQIANGTR